MDLLIETQQQKFKRGLEEVLQISMLFHEIAKEWSVKRTATNIILFPFNSIFLEIKLADPFMKQITVAHLKGGVREPPLLANFFFHFHPVFLKNCPNSMLAPPGVGAPPSGKSWIRHWISNKS